MPVTWEQIWKLEWWLVKVFKYSMEAIQLFTVVFVIGSFAWTGIQLSRGQPILYRLEVLANSTTSYANLLKYVNAVSGTLSALIMISYISIIMIIIGLIVKFYAEPTADRWMEELEELRMERLRKLGHE